MANTALVWIRDDFRIQNNDALTYATNQHDAVTTVFIFNSKIFDHKREAQKWWLSKSLINFRKNLEKFNINLEIIETESFKIFFEKLFKKNDFSLYWNKVYEPDYSKFDEYLVCLLYTSPSPRDS